MRFSLSKPSKSIISLDIVNRHNQQQDCWIVVYDRVYNITEFLNQHPAGAEILLEHAGCDASFAFYNSGHSPNALKLISQYEIGILPMEERLFSNKLQSDMI